MRNFRRVYAVGAVMWLVLLSPAAASACTDCGPRWPSCHGLALVLESFPCLWEMLVDAFWLDDERLWAVVLGALAIGYKARRVLLGKGVQGRWAVIALAAFVATTWDGLSYVNPRRYVGWSTRADLMTHYVAGAVLGLFVFIICVVASRLMNARSHEAPVARQSVSLLIRCVTVCVLALAMQAYVSLESDRHHVAGLHVLLLAPDAE